MDEKIVRTDKFRMNDFRSGEDTIIQKPFTPKKPDLNFVKFIN